MCESIKALEFKTSTLFNIDFLFLIIDFNFLFPAVITKTCNSVTELVISIGIPTKEAKAEVKTHPVTVEIKIRKCSI